MGKMLNYSTVADLCAQRKMKVKDMCSYIGITYQGLRTSLNTNKLSSDKVDALCKCLKITPNYFYGWLDVSTHDQYNSTQYGIMNNQNINNQKELEILKDQLTIKDNQIDKLISLLSK